LAFWVGSFGWGVWAKAELVKIDTADKPAAQAAQPPINSRLDNLQAGLNSFILLIIAISFFKSKAYLINFEVYTKTRMNSTVSAGCF